MNLKLRLQNRVTLTALILALIALVYQVLALFNVTPEISQDEIVKIAGMIINIAVMLGIVVDPTTNGVRDSQRAMEYKEPRKDEVE